jgi:hypothetical protein
MLPPIQGGDDGWFVLHDIKVRFVPILLKNSLLFRAT